MKVLDQILADYRMGRITRAEAVAAMLRLVTRENVAEVMAEVPAEFAEELVGWASESSAGGRVVVGANLSASDAGHVSRSYETTREAIRQWMGRETLSTKVRQAVK